MFDSVRCGRLAMSLALLFVLGATSAHASASFRDAANPTPNPLKEGIAAPAPIAPVAITDPLGTLTFYTDRTVFETAFPGLPEETFEAGNALPGGFSTCDAPLDSAGDGPCGYAAGEILDGIALQDNPGPEPAALILLGAGTSLNPTMALIANTFSDAFDIVFNPPVSAAGMDLHSTPAPGQGPPDSVNIEVFDAANVSLGTTPATASGPGNFWGVSSTTPIGRIRILSTNNQAEGVDNLSFSGEPTLAGSATGTDACPSNPQNVNDIWEPGETITLDVQLTAIAGGFTGISGTLASTTPGVVIVSGNSTWPDLAAGASAGSNTDFVVELPESLACGSAVDLEVTVTANEGGPFLVPISELVGQALEPNVPVSIPDADPAGVESELVVADDVILTDVDVRVQITHTWVGDLLITLRAPDNTEVVLLDRPGVPNSGAGCSDNNLDVTFDDASGFDPELHCATTDPWFVGTANPVGSLATFNGMSSAGTWRVFVSDNAGLDLGDIVDWELITTPPISGVCTTCLGVDEADLGITKTNNAGGTVVPGTPFLFTLTATNNGPDAAAGVVVTDAIPTAFDYVSNDCGASFAAPTLTWNVGALAAASSATCNVSVVVAAGAPAGPVVNTATVASSTADPGPVSNSASDTVNIGAGPSLLEIPTLDQAGLAVLMFGLLAAAFVLLRRR
jgi:uncharacterized repeat protein (TIGR01451 family)